MPRWHWEQPSFRISLLVSAAGALTAIALPASTVDAATGGTRTNHGERPLTPTAIAFVRATKSRGAEIYVVRQDGRGIRRVVRSDTRGQVFDPAWSSDHRRIAFTVWIKESWVEIGIIRLNGQRRRDDALALQLYSSTVGSAAWSPDDKRMAYSTFAGGGSDRAAIVVVSTLRPSYARNATRRITDLRHRDIASTWSPTGALIGFQRDVGRDGSAAIFVVSAIGGRPMRITNGGNPDWSPDGKLIAFADHGDIFVVRPNGSARTVVIGGKTNDSQPVWSPDGTKIAFVRARRASCSASCTSDLWVADRKGRNQRRLVRNAYSIDW
jgi:Tol biopolymer transport system component